MIAAPAEGNSPISTITVCTVRIIFFAGKGGVGKTSVSAATGIRAAEAGSKTVIMSLDIAHNLADIFDLDQNLLDQKKGRPHKVAKNLWIQELDIQEEIQRNWGSIHKYLSSLLNTTGLDEILAEELAILPGMEEVSLLLHINNYARSGKFDTIILDCAPTGEAIRFISIPTTLEWYMSKLFKIERSVAKYVRPIAKRVYDVPVPGDDYFQAIESLFKKLQGVDKLLVDPEITTVRLVTNPEKIVLRETQRALMYFYLYKMTIDAIIVNRLLPTGLTDDYFSSWMQDQHRHLEKARTYFHPLPLIPVNLCKGEIVGYDRLKTFGDDIYGNKNPCDHFFREEPYNLFKENGCYKLNLRLPFIAKNDVELNKTADELIVRMGSFKKHILLPRKVAMMEEISASRDGEYLQVTFQGG